MIKSTQTTIEDKIGVFHSENVDKERIARAKFDSFQSIPKLRLNQDIQ